MVKKTGHILRSYVFDGKGGGKKCPESKISGYIKSKRLAWVHLDGHNPATRGWLEEELDYLDPLIVDALLAGESRPRMEEIGEGIFINLRGVNLNEGADADDMVSIRMWVDPHRVVTIRRRKLRAVEDMAHRIEQGKSPEDAGEFLVKMIGYLLSHMEPVINALDERADAIETGIADKVDMSLRHEMVDLRMEAILYKRYIMPQRDVLERLRSADVRWLNQSHVRHITEHLDRVSRFLETVDVVRERAQIVKDEMVNAVSERMNKNTYVLSIIAAVFLPLGFLTGLLGINIAGIPGAENPDAFLIFCGGLAVMVGLQVVLFKWMKWF
jgi:zinc transporter